MTSENKLLDKIIQNSKYDIKGNNVFRCFSGEKAFNINEFGKEFLKNVLNRFNEVKEKLKGENYEKQ
jgi:hypothetical protein